MLGLEALQFVLDDARDRVVLDEQQRPVGLGRDRSTGERVGEDLAGGDIGRVDAGLVVLQADLRRRAVASGAGNALDLAGRGDLLELVGHRARDGGAAAEDDDLLRLQVHQFGLDRLRQALRLGQQHRSALHARHGRTGEGVGEDLTGGDIGDIEARQEALVGDIGGGLVAVGAGDPVHAAVGGIGAGDGAEGEGAGQRGGRERGAPGDGALHELIHFLCGVTHAV
ncbi:hypothetical protein GCM10028781_09330 [Nostocoides australiense]